MKITYMETKLNQNNIYGTKLKSRQWHFRSDTNIWHCLVVTWHWQCHLSHHRLDTWQFKKKN